MKKKIKHHFTKIKIPLFFILIVLPGIVFADEDDDVEQNQVRMSVSTDLTKYKVEAVDLAKPAVLAFLSRGWNVDSFDKYHAIGSYDRKKELSRVRIDYSDIKNVTFNYIDPEKEKNLGYLNNLNHDLLGGFFSCRFVKHSSSDSKGPSQ